jgi:hypothetical protein
MCTVLLNYAFIGIGVDVTSRNGEAGIPISYPIQRTEQLVHVNTNEATAILAQTLFPH